MDKKIKKYYKEANCLEYLESSAEKYPDKISFADDKEKLTFSEFRDSGMIIGSGLKKYNLHKDPVVILMDARHIPFLKAMAGVLYAGCFYIPLDPASPAERLEMIFERLEPALVIYDEKALKAAESLGEKYKFIEYRSLTHDGTDMEYLEQVREESNIYDILFIMYTSGSTGIPKGVVHTHADLIEYTEFTYRRYPFDKNTVFGNQSPFFYANCLLDIFPPLAVGATVYIIPSSYLSFPKKMVSYLKEKKITELCMTPSSFTAVAESGALEPGCLPDLEFILPSGEIANWKALKTWKEAASGKGEIWNFYGSTELLSVALWLVDRDFENDEIIPSGHPYRCSHVLIMDENGNEAPKGTKGEMYIHNPWMFSGYYKDSDRNASILITDPLHTGVMETFFATGDIGFINESGQLVVVGRKDSMIKHNGYRMELGEVEYAAKALAEVQDCCAVFDAESGLISLFYTGKTSEKELKAVFKEKLPRFAHPDRLVPIERLPRNANGKTDRQELKRMAAEI